jgi:hypothetical protein
VAWVLILISDPRVEVLILSARGSHSQRDLGTMAFDDPHSGADHHHYMHHQDIIVSESGHRVMMVLSVVTLVLAVFAIGYIARKEREDYAAKSR